jgi:hypothetical protein
MAVEFLGRSPTESSSPPSSSSLQYFSTLREIERVDKKEQVPRTGSLRIACLLIRRGSRFSAPMMVRRIIVNEVLLSVAVLQLLAAKFIA